MLSRYYDVGDRIKTVLASIKMLDRATISDLIASAVCYSIEVGSQYDTAPCVLLGCLHIDACRNTACHWHRLRFICLCCSLVSGKIYSWKSGVFACRAT